jgi:mRNA interferase RelE/StbE
MKWDLAITSPARRALHKVPLDDLEHIEITFAEMCSDPYSGDVKFLRGMRNIFRRRVGDWRIIFELRKNEKLILILAVKRRSSKTY